jgi:hypothetical protein
MKLPQALRHVALAAVAALTGCQSLEVKHATVEQTAEVRRGPEATPQRTITGFSSALRCMDSLLLDYGVRDVTMLVEEIVDETKKVNAGTRDMLISAVSDMTRRSRAVRLVAFGKDTANVISFLATAQRASAYEAIPLYDIKGSVTQLDENLIKNQKDLGVGISPFINLGVARDAASSVLGLDLSVLTTSDMAVLSGVTSRNSVVILKQGRGFDGDAAYRKFGINFSMNLSRSEGQTQALRGLVELAVVELVGRLTKTPYWSCLGANPQDSEEIRLEIFDWYHAMAATRVELIAYFQNQLRRRGFYDGPIDGQFNPAIDEAIANYRAQLGMSREPLLNEVFFTAFLSADHRQVKRPGQPARYVPPVPAAAAPAADATPVSVASAASAASAAQAQAATVPLALKLATQNNQTRFASGEAISLLVQPTHDAHVYCYLQDENAKIMRFYPNRFAKDSLVSASKPLALPGAMRFQLVMNDKGTRETIACFAAPRDVMSELPLAVSGTDFEPLPVASIEQIRSAFAQASGGAATQEIFHVQAK